MSVNYTITLSDAQNKALSTVVFNQQEWIENAVFERCRIAIDEIVKQEVERKISLGETISGSKEDIVLAADIETAAEKNARLEEEDANRANA